MKQIFIFSTLIFFPFFIFGCSEPSTENEYRNEIVVTGYLIAGKPIDSIVVSRTMPIDQQYTSAAAAITNAIVVITTNGIHDTLRTITGKPGHYFSPQIIQPKQKYSLFVKVPDGREIRGTTIVPDTFHIVQRPPAEMTYGQGIPFMSWTESALHHDYIMSITSLDLTETTPIGSDTPFADSVELSERTSFTFGFEDIQESQIPWFAFHFYGRNALKIFAVDKNYYEFFRQIFSQSTDIKEFKYNLQGGIGIFGSAAEDSIHLVVKRPQSYAHNFY
jgi:hypothetical protein